MSARPKEVKFYDADHALHAPGGIDSSFFNDTLRYRICPSEREKRFLLFFSRRTWRDGRARCSKMARGNSHYVESARHRFSSPGNGLEPNHQSAFVISSG
jgi:hypothetical protein